MIIKLTNIYISIFLPYIVNNFKFLFQIRLRIILTFKLLSIQIIKRGGFCFFFIIFIIPYFILRNMSFSSLLLIFLEVNRKTYGQIQGCIVSLSV